MAKKKEDKNLTKDQAIKKIETLKKDLFNIRFKKVNNQVDNDRARNLNQMEKQGMSSVNNRKSRTKDVSNYDNT